MTTKYVSKLCMPYIFLWSIRNVKNTLQVADIEIENEFYNMKLSKNYYW